MRINDKFMSYYNFKALIRHTSMKYVLNLVFTDLLRDDVRDYTLLS